MNSIRAFWREFQRLHRSLAGETPSNEAMDNILKALKQIDARLYYHLGSKDTGTDLIISAEGHADLMPTLAQLERAAPHIDGWQVVTAYEGMLVFGQRNGRVFPPTENGDVLYRMAQNGDALWIEREVNFSFVFPRKKEAAIFCAKAAVESIRNEVSRYKGAAGYSFQAEVRIAMVPSHESITSMEERLGNIARKINGRPDGWGCFRVSPS